MARERGGAAASAAASRSSAVQKHKRRTKYGDYERAPRASRELVAKPVQPKLKYQSYFEFQENKDKKKKLEIQVTDDKTPPAGFTFVPVGNPELTNVCKELSREEDALIFIVSGTKEETQSLIEHVHRIGYHFRSYIVDQAALQLGGLQGVEHGTDAAIAYQFDAIPETQEEINKQADAAIRDLFPRIPNTDREMIIQHAFQKGAVFHGKPVVGLQEGLSLSRRVQLAVIAHIRHNHTRYDHLLRETDWGNARKTVERLCLDILLKWRGDEETGRDQLDEVLREVVVISDSDNDDADGDDNETDAVSDDELQFVSARNMAPAPSSRRASGPKRGRGNQKSKNQIRKNRRAQKRHKAWEDARNRNLHRSGHSDQEDLSHAGPVTRSQPMRNPYARHDYSPDSSRFPVDNPLPVENISENIPLDQAKDRSNFYGEKVIVSSRSGNPAYYGYSPAHPGAREYRVPSAHFFSSLSSSSRPPPYKPNARNPQDFVLPSIEQTVDQATDKSFSSDPNRSVYTDGGPFRQQVMYTERAQDHASRTASSRHPNVIYVDDPAISTKRRRMAIDHEGQNFPDEESGEYLRLASRMHSDSQLMPMSTLQSRDADKRNRHDSQTQQLVLGREPLHFQTPLPTQVRVVTRGPDNEESVKILPVYDEADRPFRHRTGDEVYYERARRNPVPRVLSENERPSDVQPDRSFSMDRPHQEYMPRLPGEHFLDSSVPFSSTLHSQEFSHYPVAYSRPQGEDNSRLVSARDSYRDALLIPNPRYSLRSKHASPEEARYDGMGYGVPRMNPGESEPVPYGRVQELSGRSIPSDLRSRGPYMRSSRGPNDIIVLE